MMKTVKIIFNAVWVAILCAIVYGIVCAVKDRDVSIKQYFKRYGLIMSASFII